MIKNNNQSIGSIYYDGHLITKIYGCDGHLVFEKESFNAKVKLWYDQNPSGVTDYTYNCDGDAVLRNGNMTDAYPSIETYAHTAQIGSCVTSIGNSAFLSFTNLQNVIFPSTVTSIGSNSFQACSSLQSIVIPDSVTSIGGQYGDTFQSCINLRSVRLPSGLTEICRGLFAYCFSLNDVEIPSGVTSIGGSAFQNCSGLTEITIPSSVTSIGDTAFLDCRNLDSIVIPDSVTTIGASTYRNCINATSVTVGSGITSIGYRAFENCPSLTSMTFTAINPPTLVNSTNRGFGDQSRCPIYVPSGSVEAYKAADGWSFMASRIQAIP